MPPQAELGLSVYGIAITALIDTGADYSILSGPFAAALKKVTTAWDGPQIRTAGGRGLRCKGKPPWQRS